MIQFLKRIIYSQDRKDQTLQKALNCRDLNAVKQALELGARADAVNCGWLTPLHKAASSGDAELVQVLIASGFNVNACDNDPEQKWTPLHYSAENGHTNIARALLHAGAEPNAKSWRERTPLHYAAMHRHEEMVKLLLGHGANPNAIDTDAKSVLDIAADEGAMAIIALLIGGGANPNAVVKTHETPLLRAASRGQSDVVEILLRYHSDANVRDANGNTPLHRAATSGDELSTQLLLVHRADHGARNKSGEAPLHLAAAHCHSRIVILLLNAGADKEMSNDFGETPLLVAARARDNTLVQMLLSNGANANAQDEDGNGWRALIELPTEVVPRYGDRWSYSDKNTALKAFDAAFLIIPVLFNKWRIAAPSFVEVSLWKVNDTTGRPYTLVITGSGFESKTEPPSVGKVIQPCPIQRSRTEMHEKLSLSGRYNTQDESTFRQFVALPSVRMVKYAKIVSPLQDATIKPDEHLLVDHERSMERVAVARSVKAWRESQGD